MTELLDKAFQAAASLAPEQQDALADLRAGRTRPLDELL
jgi:hypothetical protein